MANEASPIPANTTSTVRAFVDNLRINNAYSMFPIYSKNKDQLGPFKGTSHRFHGLQDLPPAQQESKISP